MSSADTCSPPTVLTPIVSSGSNPSTGTTNGSSSQSQASTFDTQPPASQEDPEVSEQAWGQLVVIGGKLSYDMIKDDYLVGRAETSDVVLRHKQSPTQSNTLWKSCSKSHFRIYAEQKSTGRYIFIKDLSGNGTFVNNELIGKNKITVLNSGDVISIVKKEHKAFMYMDFGVREDCDGIPDIVKSKYLFVKELGRGACGVVKLAIRKEDKARLACKCINKQNFSFSSSNKTDLMREVHIITKLNHPCVIKVVDVIDTDDMLCMFMELVEGGDLFKEIKTQRRLEPEHVKMVFYQLCIAIKHLHDNHVVHRDLKPENILLSSVVPESQIVKVTDFGYSRIIETSSLLKTICGTPFYVAPEILETNGMMGGYTKAVDCWSLGVILYVCATGQPAFTPERKDLPIREQIIKGNYDIKPKYWESMPQAKDLVEKLLVVDPEKRLTLDQILDHPWFKDDVMLKQVNDLLKEEERSGFASANSFMEVVESNESAPKRRRIAGENFDSGSATPLLEKTLPAKLSEQISSSSTMDTGSPLTQANCMSE